MLPSKPGITRKALNEHLRDQGLFFPLDPGADASLGGMAATRCSGTNAVRYGTMKDNVLALKVVLADGEVMTHRAPRQEILRRLRPHAADDRLGRHARRHHRSSRSACTGIPEAIASGVCPFPSVEAACKATILDHPARHPGGAHRIAGRAADGRLQSPTRSLTLPEVPTLFVEFHGTDAGVAEQSQRFGEIAEELGGGSFDWATAPRSAAGCGRRGTTPIGRRSVLRPGTRAIATDVCVPISRLAECDPRRRKQDIAQTGLLAPIVGHVGDGNFHMPLMVDLDDGDEVGRAEHLLERVVERALAMDGTCTGEHGVGQGKMKYLMAEHGEPALDAMRAIKRALDPLDILNPGKIVAL